ncbi:hypothetical protein SEPCBS119000_003412 [Sporothrix epigloea]|uniref:Endosomal/vacuolar adapter protein YPT35 n=1 Tax=Sporothrix epigloea TaxID=1892477 RepID=A0ABP0DQR1_9PEZI
MASSSTASVPAAQPKRDESPIGSPARQDTDFATERRAADAGSNTTEHCEIYSGQNASPDILGSPPKKNEDDEGEHAPVSPNCEPDGAVAVNDAAPESSDHESRGTNSPTAAPDTDSTRLQSPSRADARPAEPNVEAAQHEADSELLAQHPRAAPVTATLGTAEAITEMAPEPIRDNASDAATATTPLLAPYASPPVPPPYWTHSRDGSQEDSSQRGRAGFDAAGLAPTAPSAKKPSGAVSMFNAPFLRRREGSSRSPAATSSSSSPASRPATSTTQPRSLTGGGGRHHHRETSSSTLDFQANIITLQDNEVSDEEEGGANNDFLANGSALSTEPPAAGWPSPEARTSSAGAHDSLAPTPSAPATRTASHSSKANRCWARRIDITDHTIIGAGGGGNKAALPKMGAFVVWTIRVQTLDSTAGAAQPSAATGHSFCVYKRYSEFDTLRQRLVASFPQARGGGALPPLPPKTVLGNFRPEFLEKRRSGLQYFLNCILLNPEFAGSPVLQDFLFA